MTTAYHTIDFPLQLDAPPSAIDFLPFGTRTLKVRVTNPDNIKGNLVLRSANTPDGFGVSEFFSHEDDGTDFRLSWGGGHERGACLRGQDRKVAGRPIPLEDCTAIKPGAESFVYVNLTHLKCDASRVRIMKLVVVPEADAKAEPLATLELTLNPPAPPTGLAALDPVRLIQVPEPSMQSDPPAGLAAIDPVCPVKRGKGEYGFSGAHVPSYLSRWWSPALTAYQGSQVLPDLRLVISGDDIEVLLVPGGADAANATVLARIHDNIKFQDIDQLRDFSAEIYHFTDRFYVLRLWFAWLWKADTETLGHEIPDAERFDLVIDPQEAKVVYAATDQHWKERWCPGPRLGGPVEIEIGLFSPKVVAGLPKLILDRFEALLLPLPKDAAPPARPATAQAAEGVHIPAEIVLQAVAGGVPAEHLGPGIEAHVPRLINCPPPEGPGFISSDPRRG